MAKSEPEAKPDEAVNGGSAAPDAQRTNKTQDAITGRSETRMADRPPPAPLGDVSGIETGEKSA